MYSRIFGTSGWHQANINAMEDEGYELLSIAWRGQAVFFMIREFAYGDRSFRIARFITADSADYLDFAGIDEVDTSFFRTLRKELIHRRVAALLLSNIVRDSLFYQSVHAFFPVVQDLDCIPALGIICRGTGMEDYYGSIGRESRRNLKRIRKAGAEAGMVFRYDPLGGEALDWILHHQEQRAFSTAYSVIKDTVVAQILRQQIPGDRFHVASVGCNGSCISGMLIGEYEKTLAVYIQAFDSRFRRYYPSLFLLSELVEYAVIHGYAYIDLLRGEEAYKKRFCNHSVALVKTLIPFNDPAGWKTIVRWAENMVE